MRQLLEVRADPFLKDTDGHTPLYVAAQEGYLPCVRILVEHVGPRVKDLLNIRLHDGCSPVMAASYEGHHEVVAYLLQNGKEQGGTKKEEILGLRYYQKTYINFKKFRI